MNIAQIRKYDVANGPGIRTTMFVSGCTHDCKNCFNKEYQNFAYGEKFNKEIENRIVSYVAQTNRLSVLGGEPMQQNLELVCLLKRVKEETDATIWMWTGYVYENLQTEMQKKILEYVDVLVDGPFIESKKDLTLKFRGSSNQRIIDVKKTKAFGRIITMEV